MAVIVATNSEDAQREGAGRTGGVPDSAASLSEGLVALCRRPATHDDRARAALHLLDWASCALAVRGEPVAAKMQRWSRANKNSGPAANMLGGTTAAAHAAFVNGALANVLEMDDLHRPSIMHAGDVVVPAALAAVQTRSASTPDDLLEALLVGYEVALRIGMAAAARGYSSFYNSAVCGVFGATMAAARATGLDDRQCVDALGQAGMQAAGIWQCRLEPTDSKQVANAHAARAGLTAATLAEAGFTGPRHVLDGELGFFASYYPVADRSAVLAQPDGPWWLHDVSFKPWPACRHTHPLIHLGLHMRDRIDVSAIEQIAIDTYQAGQSFCDKPHPKTADQARFSLQHCLAVALLRGTPTLADFNDDALHDPALHGLRKRMTVTASHELTAAFPAAMGATLRITTSDSTVVEETTTHAPGDSELPLDDAAILKKFMVNATHGGVGDDLAQQLSRCILALPFADDLYALNAALSALPPIEMETPHG